MKLTVGRLGLWAATLLAFVALEVAASPSQYVGVSMDDVRRPVYRGSTRTRELKTEAEVVVKSDISVAGAEDGRAAAGPTTPTPMAESLKSVTKQLLQAPSATDMVATDVRTPPKVKSQVKTVDDSPVPVNGFVPMGKGEVEPVVMEESSRYEIITAPPPTQMGPSSTQPSTGGLSTWILLTNGEQSTLASSRKKTTSQHPTPEPKKTHSSTTAATSTIEKVKKPDDAKLSKPISRKPVALPLKKQNATKDREEPLKSPTIVLQDPKFKNKTPVIVGKLPNANKTEGSTVAPIVLTRKRPISLSPTPPTRHVYDMVPTTSLLLETGTIEGSDEGSTTEASSSRPTTTNKKKKKNKNRRRRPTKTDSESAESKVDQTSVAPPSTKIDAARPMSTRIYNYLAREVMPSVGVGLVGLVLTAGLAGLFLYPFGGGIARRNYDKGGHSQPGGPMFYYDSYNPRPERDQLHPHHQHLGSSEPSIFGQVLSSMNQNTFSQSFDSGKYPPPAATSASSHNNKFGYDDSEFSPITNPKNTDYNINGYAGTGDYSTLPDSIKNSDYGVPTNFKSPDYSVKSPEYSVKSTDYSVKSPDYALKPGDYPEPSPGKVSASFGGLPEASKYYSMDPVSSHYKLTDGAAVEQVYPSLTDYASSYGEVVGAEANETAATGAPTAEDKSDKSQPHFSALVASPQFTNTNFVGSVSVTGGYGAQEDTLRHRTGALAAEHGPRSLGRARRDVHDDFSNEIDGGKFESSPSTMTTESAVLTSTTLSPSSEDARTTTVSSHLTSEAELSSATVAPPLNLNPPTAVSGDRNSTASNTTRPSTTDASGFVHFISQLAQVKLKLGITLIRSTGAAVTRYLDVVAKRMEEAVRNMEKRTSRHHRQLRSSPVISQLLKSHRH